MLILACSSDPIEAAKALDDKLLLKQLPEVAQILSSALFNLGSWKTYLCKPNHVHHLSVRWATRSRNNFNWLVMYGLGLCNESKRRFGKETKTVKIILDAAELFQKIPMDHLTLTPFPNLTPYLNLTTVAAWRQYLILHHWSKPGVKWTASERPDWSMKSKKAA